MGKVEIDVRICCEDTVVSVERRPVWETRDGRRVVRFRREYHVITADNRLELCLEPVLVSKEDIDFSLIASRGSADAAEPSPADKDPCSVYPGPEDWTPEQKSIIELPVGNRIVLNAGAGTGKTAVASGRVAHLLNEGLLPGEVWLISFTRTAVQELNDRIWCLLKGEARERGVWISTIDSHAWYVRSGYERSAGGILPGSYDENIRRTIDLLAEENEQLLEYLSQVRHLLVDEAQDLVGIRADLVQSLFGGLSPEAGVSLFTDPAQAIYGFSEEGTEEQDSRPPLANRLLGDPNLGFREVLLTEVQRTGQPDLLRIMTDVRQTVLSADDPGPQRYQKVREEIQAYATGQIPEKEPRSVINSGDTLALFRSRAGAANEASWMNSDQVVHRLRMSGLDTLLHPWIAMLLWDHVSPWLTRKQFDELWEGRLPARLPYLPACEEAWRLLYRDAGDEKSGRISMRAVSKVIGREKPPVDYVLPDFGWSGPIIGTIHASKGREARRVVLFLPQDETKKKNGGAPDIDEETRVLFVGASRATSELLVGDPSGRPGGRLRDKDGNSNRARSFRLLTKKKTQLRAQIEIGVEGDLAKTSPVSLDVHESEENARATQALLTELAFPAPTRLKACIPKGSDDFTYRLLLGNEADEEGKELSDCRVLGTLSEQVTADLFIAGGRVASAKKVKKKLRASFWINYLWLYGSRSVVLPPEDPRLGDLHDPWSESGIFLAPAFWGYPPVSFKRYG